MAAPSFHRLVGYDPTVAATLSDGDRDALRGVALVWLMACCVLGAAAAYSAWLVVPTWWAPVLAGPGAGLLALNLVRVVTAGGGTAPTRDPAVGEARCRRYRPSVIPAAVFGLLAGLLAQPAQAPLWPELEPQVEAHRAELIAQHDAAAVTLGIDPERARGQLETAGFPVYRMKLIWQRPYRALRITVVVCLLVMLPALWTQVVAIRAVRAYDLARYRRAHSLADAVNRVAEHAATGALAAWQTPAAARGGLDLG